ncbi:unnamed protein product [Ophioblennius macclurei]
MSIPCKLAAVIFVMALDCAAFTEAVIGGQLAKPHSRPYMALLQLGDEDDYCGGFLMTEDFVMTAAHCQHKFSSVKLGLHNVHEKDHVQHICVDQAFPHEGYNKTSKINDVMLLKLKSRAMLNDKVQTIALAEWDDDSLPKSCSISGWGRTKWKEGYMSNSLKEVNVELMKNDTCAHENVYCSYGDSGAGNGDYGGPLVCEDKNAFGVISSCFRNTQSGFLLCEFAKLQDIRHWIHSTIENALKKV